jgi:hypothetical protein
MGSEFGVIGLIFLNSEPKILKENGLGSHAGSSDICFQVSELRTQNFDKGVL